ncbi:putative uncharacterized protein C7orf78 homolog [Rhinolophus sinicus]|uniref:putative uncharacterized protein C7orf78 homolog n=1 Tax=Rhinolophus sinicus TaxID=89399 RepID=UPI003D7A8475
MREPVQYQRDLPNFVITYKRDTFELKFKSQHLITVSHYHKWLKDDKQDGIERCITYKPCQCSWDSKAILPKARWPIKSASYMVSLTFSTFVRKCLQHSC